MPSLVTQGPSRPLCDRVLAFSLCPPRVSEEMEMYLALQLRKWIVFHRVKSTDLNMLLNIQKGKRASCLRQEERESGVGTCDRSSQGSDCNPSEPLAIFVHTDTQCAFFHSRKKAGICVFLLESCPRPLKPTCTSMEPKGLGIHVPREAALCQ